MTTFPDPMAEVAETFSEIWALDARPPIERSRCLAVAGQYRYLYALVRDLLPQGGEVLDWGCGQGHFSFHLLRRGFQVTAYSLEERPPLLGALAPDRRARLRFVHPEPPDPRALPFAPHSFDAVFSVGVLEHVRETGGEEIASLMEIRRVLRPEGLFVCFHLPNRRSHIETLARALKGRNAAAGHAYHRHLFTRRQYRALCAETGFSIVKESAYGFLPRNSLAALPRPIADSLAFSRLYNGLDRLLERVLSPFAQNFLFVARAPAARR